jgi:hypothetical protein
MGGSIKGENRGGWGGEGREGEEKINDLFTVEAKEVDRP